MSTLMQEKEWFSKHRLMHIVEKKQNKGSPYREGAGCEWKQEEELARTRLERIPLERKLQ